MTTLTVLAIVITWTQESRRPVFAKNRSSLADAVRKHATFLVAYNTELVGCGHLDPTCDPQAFVVDLADCKKDYPPGCATFRIDALYETSPKLNPPIATQFINWLPDHKRAIVQGGHIRKEYKDQRPLPFDEYIVDLESGEAPFSPTRANDNALHQGMVPFETGFLFLSLKEKGDSKVAEAYTTTFSGKDKRRFSDGLDIHNHGCAASPVGYFGSLAACEVPCGAVRHPIGGLKNDPSNGSDVCLETYDIELRQSGVAVGPTPEGAASWSPRTEKDKVAFAFVKGSYLHPPGSSNGDSLYEYWRVRVACDEVKRLGGMVLHKLDGGGEWSSDGSAFYFSAVLQNHNRIGRVRMDDLNKFEPLTPVWAEASSPALAPGGDSFVCLGRMQHTEANMAPVQLFRVDAKSSGPPSFTQVTWIDAKHFLSSPRWRSVTNVRVPPAHADLRQ